MAGSLSTSAAFPKVKHSSESLLFGVDFTKLLAAGETLTGTPTVTPPPGITVSSAAVNAQSFVNDDGGTVAAASGVQFRAAGGVSPTDYVITVTCPTSTGNVRTVVCTLQVRDS